MFRMFFFSLILKRGQYYGQFYDQILDFSLLVKTGPFRSSPAPAHLISTFTSISSAISWMWLVHLHGVGTAWLHCPATLTFSSSYRSCCVVCLHVVQMFGNWTFGTLVFTVLVFTVTFKVWTQTHTEPHTSEVGGFSEASGLYLSFPTAGTGHPLLDLDQPLCHLGLAHFLCGLLTAVGRNHLVKARRVLFETHEEQNDWR